MASPDTDKMLREMARVRGFRLVKSRRRKPGGDFGRYGLKDAETDQPGFGMGERGLEASAADIENFLRGQAQSEWKSSLSAPRASRGHQRHSRPPLKEEQWPSVEASPARRTARTRPAAASAPRTPPKAAASPERPKVELKLREATGADAAAIAALIEDHAPPTARKIAATIAVVAKQGKPVIVAEEDAVVGAVSYDVVIAIQHAKPLGRIAFLVVAKDHRRRGIGAKLLREAEKRLRKFGCGAFELVNDIELSNANGFLRGKGYLRSGYRFAREIGD